MPILYLLAGLTLPWVTGYIWLAYIESSFNNSPAMGRLNRAGYGFFLGYAVLYAVILANSFLTEIVSYLVVMTSLAALTGVGGLLLYLQKPTEPGQELRSQLVAAFHEHSHLEKILWLVLMLWIITHLMFATIELLTTPVYPWDAWLDWVYRAKAWFFAGNVTSLVSINDWINSSEPGVYTTRGYAYPWFASVIPFWAAISLGSWSETLINIPVLLCAIAIGLALYGQCRASGLSTIFSLILVYFLFSIPIFGTHIALAGYADIWMAGFAGLGFVALIRGLIGKQRFPLMLGLGMIALGLLVKNEGVVWLLAALLLVFLTTVRARTAWVTLGIISLLAAIVVALSINSIELQLPGGLGFSENRITLPFIGSFSLELRNSGSAYLANFISMGNWNLTWALVFACLLCAVVPPLDQSRKVALLFIVIFIATQVMIFIFSEQAEFAVNYSAINRLPLHFIPALLFSIAVVFQPILTRNSFTDEDDNRRRTRWLTAPVLGGVLVLGGLLLFLQQQQTDEDLKAATYKPGQLQFVVGTGEEVDGKLLIKNYQDGYAMLSSGPVNLVSADHPILRLDIHSGTKELNSEQVPVFFWRQKDQPAKVSRLTLDQAQFVDLRVVEDWAGEITEFGFLFQEVAGPSLQLGEISLQGLSLESEVSLMIRDWFVFEPWSQKSVHFLYGGAPKQAIYLPPILLIWVFVTLFIFWLFSRRDTKNLVCYGLVILLAAWMILDFRWTNNGARQMSDSVANRWALSDHERMLIGLDSGLYQMIDQFKGKTSSGQVNRIIIVGDTSRFPYYIEKAKYHLLPDSTFTTNQLSEEFDPASVDYVLFIDDFTSKKLRWNDIWLQLPMHDTWRDSLQLADSGELGVLFSVAKINNDL